MAIYSTLNSMPSSSTGRESVSCGMVLLVTVALSHSLKWEMIDDPGIHSREIGACWEPHDKAPA